MIVKELRVISDSTYEEHPGIKNIMRELSWCLSRCLCQMKWKIRVKSLSLTIRKV